MDDDVYKLRQPLISSDNANDCDGSTEDNEFGGLHPRWLEFDVSTATRRTRRRRKDEEDLGERVKEFSINVEPLKLLRSAGSWLVLLSTASNFLVPRNPRTLLSTQMPTPRRKLEGMDEATERALAVLALLTIACSLLLLLVVYTQAT